MPGGNACLLDSDILLRLSKSNDPRHAAISHALRALVGQGYEELSAPHLSPLVARSHFSLLRRHLHWRSG